MGELKNQVTLKGYESQLQKLKGSREVLKFKLDGLNKELRDNKEKIKHLESRIYDLKRSDLIISEHAILRYIERVEVIPPSEVPERIKTDKLLEMVRTLGNGVYPLEDFSVKVKDNVVITVLK